MLINPETISDIGLGTWVLGESMWKGDTEPHDTIETSLEGGINLVDTAPVYGEGRSETVVGQVLNDLDARKHVFLASKCGLEWNRKGEIWRNSTPERLREEIKQSLDRLDVETIDLYQIHWPDPEVPFAESVDVLEEFRDQDLIRYIGLSNFDVEQIKQAQQGGTIDFLQPPYNLFERGVEEEILPYCQQESIRTLVYGALCRGLLTGKYDDSSEIKLEEGDIRNHDPKFTDRADEYINAVKEIGRSLRDAGHREDLAAMMLHWTVEQPGVTCGLVGARNAKQAKSNAQALEVELSESELDQIRQIADDVIDQPVGPEFMAPPS